ncbi:hypothetical protein [Janthinobacterium sp. OK676]|uniref:hypothetical protein n=1 Tax=Janthinobacterium sp. OK676 TaxID=1855295 RepID=UPI001113446D|nr:hypothetical protein [Janthinobacterium sp. OK676]
MNNVFRVKRCFSTVAAEKNLRKKNFTAIAAKRMSPLCQESSFWCHLGHQLSILSGFAQEESIYFQ